MCEPNLGKAQALVMAWRFPLPAYSPRRTCSHTRHVLLALILAASNSLSFWPPALSLTSYSSRCMVQLPAVCHSESCTNHVTKLAIILAASYSLPYPQSPTRYRSRRQDPHGHHTGPVLLAIILAASYSLAYSPRPTRYRPRRQPPHGHHTRRVLLAASYSLSFSPLAPSLTSYLSRCIVQLPAVCHSESCANHVTKLAIILTASYLLSSSPPASSSPSSS